MRQVPLVSTIFYLPLLLFVPLLGWRGVFVLPKIGA